MKNTVCVAFFALFLISCERSNKIGFIDSGMVINEYHEKKEIEKKFQLKEEGFRKRTDSIGQAFQSEVQSTQAIASKSSQKKAQQLMQGLQQKQQVLQQQMQMEQQQLALAYQREIDSAIIKVKAFVSRYGKNKGYTYILGTSDAAATVLYGAEDQDLTSVILDLLNSEDHKD